MAGPGGVLAVHAHPDDETLTSGALLATWAAAGLPALVVTCTRGERGEVIGAPLAHLEGDGPALAAHRERELAAATAALGAEQVFLDSLPAVAGPTECPETGRQKPHTGPVPGHSAGERYEDSGMAWLATGRAGSAGEPPAHALVGADQERAAGRLALLLRARRPDLVVTYEPGGGYGHPDHVRAHALTMRAVTLAADPGWPTADDAPRPVAADPAPATAPAPASDPATAPALAPAPAPWTVPGVLWAVTDPATLRAGHAALAGSPAVAALLADRTDRQATRQGPLVLPDPDGPLPSVADPARPVDVAVPVAPVRDRVLAALRAHATQVQAVTALDLPAGGPVACYALSNLVLAPLLAEETYTWAPAWPPAQQADQPSTQPPTRPPGHRPGAAPAPAWPAGVRAT